MGEKGVAEKTAAAPEAALDEAQVVAFLKANPDFLERFPDLFEILELRQGFADPTISPHGKRFALPSSRSAIGRYQTADHSRASRQGVDLCLKPLTGLLGLKGSAIPIAAPESVVELPAPAMYLK